MHFFWFLFLRISLFHMAEIILFYDFFHSQWDVMFSILLQTLWALFSWLHNIPMSMDILSNNNNKSNNYHYLNAIEISGSGYFTDKFTNLSTILSILLHSPLWRWAWHGTAAACQSWGGAGSIILHRALTLQLVIFPLYHAIPVFFTSNNKVKYTFVLRIL